MAKFHACTTAMRLPVALLFFALHAHKNAVLVSASVLVQEGRRLTTSKRDSSRLVTGGARRPATYGGSCQTIRYEDQCTDFPGTRVSAGTALSKYVYVLNGDTITKCTKYRLERLCNNCGALGCSNSIYSASGTSYGGSTITYKLVDSPGNTAALTGIETKAQCNDVCTSTVGELVFLRGKKACLFANDWLSLDDDYAATCPERQPCAEVEITQACEGTTMAGIVGKYELYEGDCPDANQLYSVYKSITGGDWLFLEASTSTWIVSRRPDRGCGNWDSPGLGNRHREAWWNAGDEPFLDAADTIRCFNGYKDYRTRDFAIRCTKNRDGSRYATEAPTTSPPSSSPTAFRGCTCPDRLLFVNLVADGGSQLESARNWGSPGDFFEGSQARASLANPVLSYRYCERPVETVVGFPCKDTNGNARRSIRTTFGDEPVCSDWFTMSMEEEVNFNAFYRNPRDSSSYTGSDSPCPGYEHPVAGELGFCGKYISAKYAAVGYYSSGTLCVNSGRYECNDRACGFEDCQGKPNVRCVTASSQDSTEFHTISLEDWETAGTTFFVQVSVMDGPVSVLPSGPP